MGTEFRATLRLDGKTATGIPVPPEVLESLGAGKRPRVTATLGDYTYRTTLGSMGGETMLPVSAEHRTGAGLAAGDEVLVRLVVDDAPREVEVPAELAAALEGTTGAQAAFDALSPSARKRHALSVSQAKAAETRQRRVEKVLQELGFSG